MQESIVETLKNMKFEQKAFSIPEPFGGLPFARRRSSLSISHLSLFYFSAPAVYLLSPPVPFFILFCSAMP